MRSGKALPFFSILGGICLCVVIIACGFGMCLTPFATDFLSRNFATDDVSPFNRTQLVEVANAERDYAFISHDIEHLLDTEYKVNTELAESADSEAALYRDGAPRFDRVEPDDYASIRTAIANANERYVIPPDAVSHLDDCYSVAIPAYIAICGIAIILIICLIVIGVLGRRRSVGKLLLTCGIIVLAAFAGLGVWASIDFNGFFAVFHGLFFSQGTWEFAYDSLMICSLPTAFWVGMGVIWLATSIVASILFILIGRKLLRGRKRR